MKKLYQYMMTFLVCLGLLVSGYLISKLNVNKQVDHFEEAIDLQGLVFTSGRTNDFNELPILKPLEEELNLNIRFIQVSSLDKSDQSAYILRMKEIPDFIMGGDFSNNDIYTYIENNIIISLDELIKERAPHIQALFEKYPIIKQYCTYTDGKIYTLPFYNENEADTIENYLFINKTWLEKLGLSVPTTTEEFYTVLKAFKQGDPNQNGEQDEIPFSYIDNIPKFSLDSFIGAFGIINNDRYLMVQDGKVHFVPEQEAYKESIDYLRKLYQEELLDAEVFTHNLQSYATKGNGDEAILGAFIAKDCSVVVGEERANNDYIAIMPLKGPKGDRLWGKINEPIKGNQFMLTTTNAYPKETIAWIDQFFDPEKAPTLQWGAEGVTLEKVGDSYQAIKPPDGKNYVQFRIENSVAFASPGILTKEMIKKYSTLPTEMRKQANYLLYEPYLSKEHLCLFAENRYKQQEIEYIYNNLHKYVTEMKIRWISGERDIETGWQNYLKALKEMGASRYVEIYQEIYDNCKRATRHH